MELSAATFAMACAMLCVILSAITWHMRRRRLYEAASKFDGPPVLPIIGNAHLLVGDNEAMLGTVAELVRSYPSPFRFWLGPRLFIVVTNPEQLKAIFLSPKAIEKSDVYKFLRPVFGKGLLTAPGQKWRVDRKLIQPTFNAKILNSYVRIFAGQSNILASRMEKNLDGLEFEIFDFLAMSTMEILLEAVMGVNIGSEAKSIVNYVDALQKIDRFFAKRIFSLWLHPDFIFRRTQIATEQQREIETVVKFTENVIRRQKIKHLKPSSQLDTVIHPEDEECEWKSQRSVFLDTLFKLSHDSNAWSDDQELRDQVNTMSIAGFDTSAVTNCLVMLMLASNPDVQEKAYQELYEIYGDADIDEREVTEKDLGRMNYLERVIKETLRLFPVAAILLRALTDDLNIGEHTLPKDSELFIPVLEVHRSEKYWPDPLRFDPDRFLPEEIAKRHPYSYLPFSAGPRNCIGLRYAMMSMKTLQATILRRYILKKDNVVPVEDIRLSCDIALKTVDPITLRIERRTRNLVSLSPSSPNLYPLHKVLEKYDN